MKIQQNRVRSFLVLLFVAQCINLTAFTLVKVEAGNLASYIYQNTSAQFLVQAPTPATVSNLGAITQRLTK